MARNNYTWKQEFQGVFLDSIAHIYHVRRYIYAIACVFLAGSLIGFWQAAALDAYFAELIAGLSEQTQNLDFLQMFWFIFSNNVTSAFLALMFGIFFGLFPLFNALFNGALLGYVYSKASAIAGYGVLWRLFPHGVFELPAVFISLGLGIHVGAALFGRNKKQTLIDRLKKSLRTFLTVVFGLLGIAALIESALIVYGG